MGAQTCYSAYKLRALFRIQKEMLLQANFVSTLLNGTNVHKVLTLLWQTCQCFLPPRYFARKKCKQARAAFLFQLTSSRIFAEKQWNSWTEQLECNRSIRVHNTCRLQCTLLMEKQKRNFF